MTIMYKLVSQECITRKGMYWEIGKTNRASGPGSRLCSDGLLHCYASPEQAALFNPVHANIKDPILFEIECSEILVDDGLKYGCKEQTPIRELPLPVFSTEQLIEFGIRCELLICEEKKFVEWAERWLSGEDRTRESAKAVAAGYAGYAAYAAYAARAANAADAKYVACAAVYHVDAANAARAIRGTVDLKSKIAEIIKELSTIK